MKRKNQGGQMIVEAILILVLFMGFALVTANYFKDQEILKHMISDPWQSLAGMLQNGVWGSPDKTNAVHPNAHFRHIIIKGEFAK